MFILVKENVQFKEDIKKLLKSLSPRISEDIRNKMGEAAVKLAKKIKYESAGTVEFLFDDKLKNFGF